MFFLFSELWGYGFFFKMDMDLMASKNMSNYYFPSNQF